MPADEVQLAIDEEGSVVAVRTPNKGCPRRAVPRWRGSTDGLPSFFGRLCDIGH
jgi:hypothetical protein